MKDEIQSPFDINKIEFWGATVLYVISIFLLVSAVSNEGMIYGGSSNNYRYEEYNLKFSYFSNYLIPQFFRNTIFYASYLVLVFYIVPALVKRRNIALNVIFTLAIFITIGLVFGITDTWLKSYLFPQYGSKHEVYDVVFKANFMYALWLMIIFAIYSAIKYGALYLLTNSDKIQARYRIVTRDGIIVFILWMISFFMMLIGDAPKELLALYGILVPFGIGLYWYSLSNLIPRVQGRRRKFVNYLGKVIIVLILSLLPLALLILSFFNHGDAVGIILTSNAAFQFFITAPVSWYIFKQRHAVTAELTTLKTALGHSAANLDLLRTQINPHFLFNALNTLYGTALQENADRTSEGIQKLGDMMRFMLEENMQDKITLNREIDYINNYISLQKLRTQSSPDIIIQTDINDQVNSLSITPMLLIPFIENAFKHGISLREPSHIKITLQITGKNLFFDVYNSIHTKTDQDPEKDKSGIGLNNVRQRLQLSYPRRHELIIRENAKEFFVHLTIQLT